MRVNDEELTEEIKSIDDWIDKGFTTTYECLLDLRDLRGLVRNFISCHDIITHALGVADLSHEEVVAIDALRAALEEGK